MSVRHGFSGGRCNKLMLAYLDCFSGVSGNMLLGALLGAGLDESVLHEVIVSLNLDGCRLKVERPVISGLQSCLVRVESRDEKTHRHLSDIESLLTKASLEPEVRGQSLKIFHRLAQAEAKVHGCSIDAVHFHEVGAVDTLVDVVGTVAGLRALGIDAIVCSPLPMPRGWVSCEHGNLPLPAPAVCALLEGVEVYGETVRQELVTPTGSAIVAELASHFGALPTMHLRSTGYGAGTSKREDGRPNLLRIMIGDAAQGSESSLVEVIETHLDDWNSETWPYTAQRLLQEGALDVGLISMQMKKGRPGYLLRVICDPSLGQILKQIVFQETSSIGLRSRMEQRTLLPREIVSLETPWGTLQTKKIATPDGTVLTPEYEDCVRMAKEQGVSMKALYNFVAGQNSFAEKKEDNG